MQDQAKALGKHVVEVQQEQYNFLRVESCQPIQSVVFRWGEALGWKDG